MPVTPNCSDTACLYSDGWRPRCGPTCNFAHDVSAVADATPRPNYIARRLHRSTVPCGGFEDGTWTCRANLCCFFICLLFYNRYFEQKARKVGTYPRSEQSESTDDESFSGKSESFYRKPRLSLKELAAIRRRTGIRWLHALGFQCGHIERGSVQTDMERPYAADDRNKDMHPAVLKTLFSLRSSGFSG